MEVWLLKKKKLDLGVFFKQCHYQFCRFTLTWTWPNLKFEVSKRTTVLKTCDLWSMQVPVLDGTLCFYDNLPEFYTQAAYGGPTSAQVKVKPCLYPLSWLHPNIITLIDSGGNGIWQIIGKGWGLALSRPLMWANVAKGEFTVKIKS